MTARTLMVMGSMSSVGKSLLVTALGRIFARRGVRVAPFKAQNLSNNAAVCRDGGEIGRAQALQALACGIAPTVDMNPVLLKPEADTGVQVVVLGRPWQPSPARDADETKAELWRQVTAALDRVRGGHDLVLIEGAGSAAELNLRAADIVNFAIARYANAPVLLAGDIDRGGIFAQLLGTLSLLEPEERALVRGFVVNKFRGDPALFADGVRILEERGGVPVLGVMPYLGDLILPDEDAVSIESAGSGTRARAGELDVAVVALPRIANFDDFDALKAEPRVRLRYVHGLAEWGQPDAVIVPGTKSTLADLAWLRATGLADAVQGFAATGGAVVGICGGYQMLGRRISDPHHVESRGDTSADGLGLLPTETVFDANKTTHQATATIVDGPGWLRALLGETVRGYEIHMGATQGGAAWLRIDARGAQVVAVPDGAVSPDARIWGTYLHGLFANDSFRHAWLESLGWMRPAEALAQDAVLSKSIDDLADAVAAALDLQMLDQIIWGERA